MTAKEYFEAIDAAYRELPPDGIERRLIELADMCSQEHGGRSKLQAALKSEIGGFYRGRARYAEAEAMFLSAAEILGSEDDPDTITALNNLAGTYRLMKRFDEAERLFLKCLSGYEAALGKEHILYASCLNNIALLYTDTGDTDRAADCLMQASDVLAALPERRFEYASSLGNIGALLYRTGGFAKAEGYLRNAAELYETEIGTRTPHYHAALNTLGCVLLAKGNFAQAEETFERALNAANAMYGPEHPETRALVEALEITRKRSVEAHEGN